MELAHNRTFVLRTYRQETHEMLFGAHNHPFQVLAGVSAQGLGQH